MTVGLYLYGRRDCHLCAEMKSALLRYGETVSVVDIDVDQDAGLVRKYGARVPVLTDTEGHEICRYFLDDDALAHHLGAR